jgi:hypothetical protein
MLKKQLFFIYITDFMGFMIFEVPKPSGFYKPSRFIKPSRLFFLTKNQIALPISSLNYYNTPSPYPYASQYP